MIYVHAVEFSCSGLMGGGGLISSGEDQILYYSPGRWLHRIEYCESSEIHSTTYRVEYGILQAKHLYRSVKATKYKAEHDSFHDINIKRVGEVSKYKLEHGTFQYAL